MRPCEEYRVILLKNADVYAPEALGHCDVLVAGEHINTIGASISAPPSDWDVETLDLEGAILVPGLIDAHTHLTGGGGEGGARTRVPALQLTELTLHGVTTAIGLLGTDTVTRSIAENLAVARGLDELGLTALCYTGGYDVPPVTLTGSVRQDIVHIDRIVAAGEIAISDHRSSQPTFEEILRIAADCHVAGMMTGKAGLLHLHLGDGRRGLDFLRRARDEAELPLRVFHPTHVNRNPELFEEALTWGASGGYVDVTAFPDDDDDIAVPAHTALLRWHEAGLPWERITLSSDGGGCIPTFNEVGELQHMDVGTSATLLQTVRRLVAAGVPLADALQPVTSSVASLFRLHSKGGIATGRSADLAVLNSDLTVRHVLSRGRWLVRDGSPIIRGLFE